jgi:plastocyanin/mono/diheme cytochrome c family protein
MKFLERSEAFTLIALILILVGLPVAVLGYQFTLRPVLADVRTIDIVAAAPEKGGFQPESIRVAAGETVRLRFSVPDVTHGIAIGPGMDVDLGHVDPGQVEEVEVTFDKPGRYSFYCNSWCSLNHWRMRGTIDVYDPANPGALVADDVDAPVLDALIARQVDIDAPHKAGVTPSQRPSATEGSAIVARLGDELPSQLADPMWRRGHSPFEAWMALTEADVPEIDAWDAVAYLWLADKDEKRLEKAAPLYAKNCAACHGEYGDGQGPGADALVAQGIAHDAHMESSGPPTAFADPEPMLGGTSEVYYAKLRRGGMGTGMPGFGSLFTSDETWALVDLLWTFVFDK